MTTISARVDENLKDTAESIADEIGLSLSAVINVFLKRFVLEKGFPFELKIHTKTAKSDFVTMSTDEITELIKKRVMESSDIANTPPITYLDPMTGEVKTQAL